MLTQITAILEFMLAAFLHTWPYLLITIPLAVAVNLSGASRYIQRAFQAQPVVAIFLATAVGAFSPFCSCGVIPVVAALLIGGVPLGPVMAFWIASPSMDPEVFFLSAGMVGWELAVWRLAGTLALSLSAGFITQALLGRGWLGTNILRAQKPPRLLRTSDLLRTGYQTLKARLSAPVGLVSQPVPAVAAAPAACCDSQPVFFQAAAPALELPMFPANERQPLAETSGCSSPACSSAAPAVPSPSAGSSTCDSPACSGSQAAAGQETSFWARLVDETVKAVVMVVQFMALAYFLEALIEFYVPEAWIIGLLGQQNALAIPLAGLLGVPVYTSNLTALPMISGLLHQGMNPAAALAFLISGPITTLPAMSAVWGLVSRRVFALYIAFALFGALALGYVYQVFLWLR